jgi:alkanesulfonate monooxygenase SsuD/methylene tetrahydromethanopterin reductase-like flavin-dependent oxidoreductase (luciferase family)
MLEIVSQVLSAGDTEELRARGNALIVAGQKNRSEALQAAASMRSWIDEQQRDWLSSGISSQQIRKIRRLLVDAAASGTVVDYGTAEQGLLSIVTLTTYLGDDARLADAIDALFDGLGNDEAFRPPNYAAAAKRVVERF